MKSNKFIKAKVCHIPGTFSNSVRIVVDESVPDEVVKKYALSRTWDGHADKLKLEICKMKPSAFEATKVTIPDQFYK